MAKKIIVADDHSLTRIGMGQICKDIFKEVVIVECSTIDELFEALSNHKDIDLLILDNFFGQISSLQYFDEIKKHYYLPRTLMISLGNDDVFAIHAIREGAKGYINKQATSAEVKKAITDVMIGDFYLSPQQFNQYIRLVSNGDGSLNPFESLSGREFQIALYLIKGMETKEIGVLMDLKSTTVSTYKGRIFEKLRITKDKELWDLGLLYGIDTSID